jgi:hypothetical protein
LVHSLFKDYNSCARSFSPPPSPALPCLSRLARSLLTKLLKQPPTLLLLQLTLLQWPLTPPRLPLLLPRPPLQAPLLLLRALLVLLRMPLAPLRMPQLPLRILPRKCNLRLLANFSGLGARTLVRAPFSLLG